MIQAHRNTRLRVDPWGRSEQWRSLRVDLPRFHLMFTINATGWASWTFTSGRRYFGVHAHLRNRTIAAHWA